MINEGALSITTTKTPKQGVRVTDDTLFTNTRDSVTKNIVLHMPRQK